MDRYLNNGQIILTLISTSEVVPITLRAPSFFLGSRLSGGSLRMCTQYTITGSNMFFLF